MKHLLKVIRMRASVAAVIALGAIVPARADLLPIGVFAEFSFTDAGTPAIGCAPVDPTGNFCIPSSGTPSVFLGTPPWTFTSLEPSFLTVTDAFVAGDRFQVFDFGVSLGLTSLPSGNTDCGDDPVPCLATAGISHGTFSLGAGNHQITITPILAPSGGGAGYLQVQVTQIPEPSTWMLLGGCVVAIKLSRQRAKRKGMRPLL
jgi:hypothetical protein